MWSLPHRGGAFSQGDSVPIPIPANSTLRFSAALKQKSLMGVSRAFSPLALRRSSVLIMGAICALGVSNATTLSVVGPDGVSSSFTATVGNSIEVGVLTDSFSDLYAWQFDLNWDPTILTLNGVTEGGALASAGTTFFVPGTIDNVGGSATANADTVIGGASGATGTNRVLAYFDFSAIGVGKTAITINNVTLLDSNLNNIDETSAPGTATVGGSVTAAPEPAFRGLVLLFTIVVAVSARSGCEQVRMKSGRAPGYLVGAAVIAFGGVCGIGHAQTPKYTVALLSVPAGLTGVSMYSLNDSGQAIGFGYDAAGRSQAFIASTSGSALFPLPPGADGTQAFDINDSGQACVLAIRNKVPIALFIGTPSAIAAVPLPSVPSGASVLQQGCFINNSGQVTATIAGSTFIGSLAKSVLVPTPPGFGNTAVGGINASGQVAVTAVSGLYIANASGVSPIPVPAGFNFVGPSAINDSGQVVSSGFFSNSTSSQSFVLTTSQSYAIPLPAGVTGRTVMYPGGEIWFPRAINNSGTVVGTVDNSGLSPDGINGFIWDPVDGTRLLTDLVPPAWPVFFSAAGISNRGQILASVAYENNVGWVLLSPPSSIVVSQDANPLYGPLTDLTVAPTVAGKFRNNNGLNGNSNVQTLYVRCYDASSNPIKNCQLSINLQVMPGSGGHTHDTGDPNRPPGEIAASQTSLSSDGSSPGKNALTLATDSNGSAKVFYYLPSLVGGDTVAKITETGGLGIPETDLNLHVRTTGANCPDPASASSVALCAFPSSGTTFALTGAAGSAGKWHQANHFGTNAFNQTLLSISQDWYNGTPVPFALIPLAINDMSLIDGGIFDLGKGDLQATVPNWTAPHAWHRWGDAADIGSGALPKGVTNVVPSINYWIPPAERARFRMILDNHHYYPMVEGKACTAANDLGATCTHYHIQPTQPK